MDQMNLALFTPEWVILAGAFVALLMSAFDVARKTAWTVSVGFAVAGLVACVMHLNSVGEPFFPGIYSVDLFSQLLKVGIVLGLTLTMLVSADLPSVMPRGRADVPVFLFMSTLGLMMLVSATELLTLYVALELGAYGMYILAALHRLRREGSEAAAKYIIFGAASSAVSLYGISLIYGLTRTTYLDEILAHPPMAEPLFIVAMVLVLSGFLFKLALFPFHAWAPDTYQGAPHQAATFIGTASKVAAVGVLLRVLGLAMDADVLVDMLLVLCVISMTFGNLAAIVQKDLKRLLAYSTIAHAGYVLIGLLTFSPTGAAAAIFYVLTYVVIAFCAFLVVCAVGSDGDNPDIESLSGLYERSPLLALVLLVAMFGLAGIPPTPGFAGKWFLFAAALERGMFGLVLIAAINATISLYYYLRVVKQAYLAPPGERGPVKLSAPYTLAAVFSLVTITVIGFYPTPIWDLAMGAARAVIFNL